MSDATVSFRHPTVLEELESTAETAGRLHPASAAQAASAENAVILRARASVDAIIASVKRYEDQDEALREEKNRARSAEQEAERHATEARVAEQTQQQRVDEVRRQVLPAPSAGLVIFAAVLHASAQAIVMLPTVVTAFFPPDPMTGAPLPFANEVALAAGFGIGIVLSGLALGSAWYAGRSRLMRWLPAAMGVGLALGVAGLRYATLPPGPSAMAFAFGLLLIELVLCMVLEALSHVVRERHGWRQNLGAEEQILAERQRDLAARQAERKAHQELQQQLQARIGDNLERLTLARALQDRDQRDAFVHQAERVARDAFKRGQARAA